MALLALENLTFTYPAGKTPALQDVNIALHAGEFVVLCGRSGCGKSTLLRHLKTPLIPHGTRTGRVLFCGKPLPEVDLRTQTARIGFVMQNPDAQLVTDKVWHELAFGLESLGENSDAIRLRVAEMASFFGIQDWYNADVAKLSGGQKQLLNLASVMALQPQVLLLDEPTSQLDPIAASDFLTTLKKINQELGTAILLGEHRLEDAIPLADRVVVLTEGRVTADEPPARVGYALRRAASPMLEAMPAPMRIFLALEKGEDQPCPTTVREGRAYLQRGQEQGTYGDGVLFPRQPTLPEAEQRNAQPPVISLKDVWFRYSREEEDVLRGFSLTVHRGELYCLVGGNGSGKTTALEVVQGQLRAYRGRVEVGGQLLTKRTPTPEFYKTLGVLPQDPQTLFLKQTVEQDLLSVLPSGLSEEEKAHRVARVAETTEITPLLQANPYDMSGGEQQRAALAKILLRQPQILLLDEPTKGMDSFFKTQFARLLTGLRARGTTLLMVSHDIEFCAAHASRCGLFFNGGIVTQNTPRAFFAGNSFYTTATNRMCRPLYPNAITMEDVILLCKNKT